jgi:hypothetical protein
MTGLEPMIILLEHQLYTELRLTHSPILGDHPFCQRRVKVIAANYVQTFFAKIFQFCSIFMTDGQDILLLFSNDMYLTLLGMLEPNIDYGNAQQSDSIDLKRLLLCMNLKQLCTI